MNILIATTDKESSTRVTRRFSQADTSAYLFVVESTDDFIDALNKDSFDFIVADSSFDGIDIWQLAKLINSAQLSAHALPLFVMAETCDVDIPVILAKEYSFKITPINQLPEILQAAYQVNQQTGYVRGPVLPDKPTILVIDDDEDAAEVVYQALKADYHLDIACDGYQGLALWKSQRHDLVLLDYMLPNLKGDEVLEQIMAIDKNQPVIIVTAYDEPTFNKNFLLNGASQYLPKPFTLPYLRSQCLQILSKAKLIYHVHYNDARLEKIYNLVHELEHQLNCHNFEKAKRVLNSIKLALPCHLTEDDHVKWLHLESLP